MNLRRYRATVAEIETVGKSPTSPTPLVLGASVGGDAIRITEIFDVGKTRLHMLLLKLVIASFFTAYRPTDFGHMHVGRCPIGFLPCREPMSKLVNKFLLEDIVIYSFIHLFAQ